MSDVIVTNFAYRTTIGSSPQMLFQDGAALVPVVPPSTLHSRHGAASCLTRPFTTSIDILACLPDNPVYWS